MKKRTYLLLILFILIVGCAPIPEEELRTDLNNLNDDELSYVLSDDNNFVGEASKTLPIKNLTRLSPIKRSIKPYKVSCIDSDGGRNYEAAGAVTLFNYPGGVINRSDKCWNNGINLQEYVCRDGKYKGDHTFDCSSLGKNYVCKGNKCLEESKFLIITSNELLGPAERLAKIRQSEGISTIVQNFDELDINRDPNLLLSWLTNFKKDNPSLKYLLLFGNSNKIPTFYSENPEADLETITDFKYSLPKDNLPTLAVGRIPVRDSSQADLWINKIEAYESYNPDPDVFLFGYTAEYDGYAETHKDEIESKGFTVSTYKPESNSSVADDILNEAGPIIANEINEGKGFSIFYGHGTAFIFHPVFHISNLALLNNKEKPTIVFTGGCDTANYNYEVPGIAEEFLANEDGAIAVIGATREGGYGYDYKFIPDFFENCNANRLGDVFNSAVKENYYLVINEDIWTLAENQVDWANYFVERMTLLGDPTTLVCQN